MRGDIKYIDCGDVIWMTKKDWEKLKKWFKESPGGQELEEYKTACEEGNIVEVLDAICDITYVSLGNATMLHGLKDVIEDAYAEVQASNMSKSCKTEEEAIQTVTKRSEEQKEPCHYEKIGEYWVVFRTRDKKVMKNINYFRPNLKKFFH